MAVLCTAAKGRSYQWRPRFKRGILCILAPGLRPDTMSYAGHPLVHTPVIDHIRNEGVLFRNAYGVTSLPAASLESILTGSYPHLHGVINSKTRHLSERNVPYLPDLLEKMKFKTAVISAGPDTPFNQENIDRLTGQAGEFLRSSRRDSFALFLELPSLEPPLAPLPRFAGLFSNVKLPPPAAWDDTFETKPAWQRRKNPWIIRTRTETVKKRAVEPWNPHDPFSLNYFRAVTAIDEAIGRILQILTITGQLDSTLTIVSGTYGCMLGEHRLTGGRYAYEESIRIPLLFRFPRTELRGSSFNEPVLSIDIAPTLLRWIWFENPNPFQGESLMPLFEGKQTEWRTSFLYEYWMADTPVVPNTLAVRTQRYKYIHYPGIIDLDELYDLENDPHELKNLCTDLHYTAALVKMKKEYDRLLQTTGYREITPPPRTSPVTQNLPRGLLINYTFEKVRQGIIPNRSLFPLNAPLAPFHPVGNGKGGLALRIEKNQTFEIPRSSLLDLAVGPWAVIIRFRADSDGVILSHGGPTNHYAVFVENGIPSVSLRKGRATVVLSARENCIGKWIDLRLNINSESAVLTVNHQREDQCDIPDLMYEHHYTIRMGANPALYGDPSIMKGGLPVLATGFSGAVDSLKIIRQ